MTNAVCGRGQKNSSITGTVFQAQQLGTRFRWVHNISVFSGEAAVGSLSWESSVSPWQLRKRSHIQIIIEQHLRCHGDCSYTVRKAWKSKHLQLLFFLLGVPLDPLHLFKFELKPKYVNRPHGDACWFRTLPSLHCSASWYGSLIPLVVFTPFTPPYQHVLSLGKSLCTIDQNSCLISLCAHCKLIYPSCVQACCLENSSYKSTNLFEVWALRQGVS